MISGIDVINRGNSIPENNIKYGHGIIRLAATNNLKSTIRPQQIHSHGHLNYYFVVSSFSLLIFEKNLAALNLE